jgi:aryl-alcohol dehydrogenase-like predicted oxidoreductase
MEKRAIGKTGLAALPLMLGGNVFGWTVDRRASFEILDAFVDAGGALIDTADIYSAWAPGNAGGESELMIGEWLRSRRNRDQLLIATKVGLLDGDGGTGLSATRIEKALDESLKRLGTDRVDIYFAHRDDISTPLEESLEAFDRAVKAGKVRILGASNFSPERIEEALNISEASGWSRFEIVEPRYNLLQREEFEGKLQDLILKTGLASAPYYALANGYLAGKYRNESDIIGSPREKWLKPMFAADPNGAMLEAMDQISKETGASLVAIAIAWVLAQPGVTAPIASATSATQLQALFNGLNLTLSPDQLDALQKAGGGRSLSSSQAV